MYIWGLLKSSIGRNPSSSKTALKREWNCSCPKRWDNQFPLFSRELHLVNMAIENGPLEDVPPIKTEGGFSIAMLVYPQLSDILDRCPRSTCLTAKRVLFWDHRTSMDFTRGFRTMHLRAMYFMYTPVIEKNKNTIIGGKIHYEWSDSYGKLHWLQLFGKNLYSF